MSDFSIQDSRSGWELIEGAYLGDKWFYDAPYSALPIGDNQFQWFNPIGGDDPIEKIQVWTGSTENPRSHREEDVWIEPHGFDSHSHWLQSIYIYPKNPQIVLGFLHCERKRGVLTSSDQKIGLAASFDGGKHFKVIGYIAEPNHNWDYLPEPGLYAHQVDGAPYALTPPDNPDLSYLPDISHLIVYFRDIDPVTQRSHITAVKSTKPLSHIIANASAIYWEAKDNQYYLEREIYPWNKWFEGNFSQPGSRGKSSPLPGLEDSLIHGSTLYSPEKGYSIATYDYSARGIATYTSPDGIHWENKILHNNELNTDGYCAYAFLVDPQTGTSSGMSSEDYFWIYTAYSPTWESDALKFDFESPPDWENNFAPNFNLKYLYRKKLKL